MTTDEHRLGAAFMNLMQKGIGQTNGTLLFDVAEKTQTMTEELHRRIC
jgi:membrane protease subunit (stomatin/prohibitin family)